MDSLVNADFLMQSLSLTESSSILDLAGVWCYEFSKLKKSSYLNTRSKTFTEAEI